MSRSGPADASAGTKVKIADGSPEDALRTFVLAMAGRDDAALRTITLPAQGFEWLMSGPPAPASLLKELQERLALQPFRRLKAGDSITLPSGQPAVIKPEDVGPDQALLLPQGARLPTRLQRIKGHWKVDPSGVIAGRKASESARKSAAQKNAGGLR